MGAIIVDSLDSPTRVLAARRTRPAALAGLWEFPGGKLEPGETPEAGLARELDEEFATEVVIGDELVGADGPWPISATHVLRLFFAELRAGAIAPGADHDRIRWLEPPELESIDWLPSDRLAVTELRARMPGG